MKENNFLKEAKSIADILSGEAKLQEEEEKRLKDSNRADRRKQEIIDEMVANGEITINKEISSVSSDVQTERKVVQNIKLYEWKAPIRLKFAFDRKVYFTAVILSAIFIVYLVILGQYGLMGAIIALLFFIYVSGTYDPIDIKNRITTRGIETPISIEEDKDIIETSKLYEWYMMEDFAFYNKNEQILLIVRTKLRFPSKLMLIADKKQIKPIFNLLQDKILYRDLKKNPLMDKIVYGDYLSIETIFNEDKKSK